MKLPQINQVILLIIVSEFIIVVASTLISPIFALFITEDLNQAAQVIGFAIAIYWVTKSIFQLPIARYLDKNHGEIDDYYSMIGGIFITTIVTFLYYFAETAWHVYLLQFFMAAGDAFVVPPFYAIFTRHIDKNEEGYEWALRSSFSLGAGSAIGAALSGVLGAVIGFRALFLVNGVLMLIGLTVLLFLRPWIIPRGRPPTDRVLIERPRM